MPVLGEEEIDRRFSYHPPDSAGRKRDHETVRTTVKQCAQVLNGILPAGRETALAMTALEEVMFWANAAVARQPQENFASRPATH